MQQYNQQGQYPQQGQQPMQQQGQYPQQNQPQYNPNPQGQAPQYNPQGQQQPHYPVAAQGGYAPQAATVNPNANMPTKTISIATSGNNYIEVGNIIMPENMPPSNNSRRSDGRVSLNYAYIMDLIRGGNVVPFTKQSGKQDITLIVNNIDRNVPVPPSSAHYEAPLNTFIEAPSASISVFNRATSRAEFIGEYIPPEHRAIRTQGKVVTAGKITLSISKVDELLYNGVITMDGQGKITLTFQALKHETQKRKLFDKISYAYQKRGMQVPPQYMQAPVQQGQYPQYNSNQQAPAIVPAPVPAQMQGQQAPMYQPQGQQPQYQAPVQPVMPPVMPPQGQQAPMYQPQGQQPQYQPQQPQTQPMQNGYPQGNMGVAPQQVPQQVPVQQPMQNQAPVPQQVPVQNPFNGNGGSSNNIPF